MNLKKGKFVVGLLPYYLLKLFSRNKKLWLITSRFGHSFSGNPKAIFLHLMENSDHELQFYFITKNKVLYNQLVKQYPSNVAYYYSFKGKYLAIRAGVYIYNHNIRSISFRLSGGVISVNTWHGLALKKIKYDNKFNSPENDDTRIGKQYILDHSNTFVCATSEFTKNEFARAFRKSTDQILITGYPRNGLLSPAQKEENRSDFINKYQIKEPINKFLFYLPTHSNTEEMVFQEFKIDKINSLCAKLNILLLYKLHPSSSLQIDSQDYSNILILDKSEELYSILSFTDLLITDYSSIFFDYLLLNRPIIFFAPDLQEYIERSRELYFKYDEFVPGPIARTHNDLASELKEFAVNRTDNHKVARKEVLNKFFDHRDFDSSKRFVNTLVQTLRSN